MVRRPSGSLKTAVSRKASLLSFSVSMVKRMEGCWLFRCGRSQLVRPKDAVDPAKQDGVVYRIPCECGKVYIGETGRPMQDRIKEHDRRDRAEGGAGGALALPLFCKNKNKLNKK